MTGPLDRQELAFVQVRCTDMEDYARIHNEGYAEAVRQFAELLGDVRQDLATPTSSGDLMAWLDDAVQAMRGPGSSSPEQTEALVLEFVGHIEGARIGDQDIPELPAWLYAFAERLLKQPIARPRPLPTREQVAQAIHTASLMHQWKGALCKDHCQDRYLTHADAVLDLLSKGAGQ